MDNLSRQELLLEVVKDMTQMTYPEYDDEEEIKEKIMNYLKLYKKFKDFRKDDKSLDYDDMKKLNELYIFFFGTPFDPSNDMTNIYRTPIYDRFKSTFDKIEKLMEETNEINAELLKALINLITIYYNSDKNKDEVLGLYLDKVIIPTINSFRDVDTAIKIDDKIMKVPDKIASISSQLKTEEVPKEVKTSVPTFSEIVDSKKGKDGTGNGNGNGTGNGTGTGTGTDETKSSNTAKKLKDSLAKLLDNKQIRQDLEKYQQTKLREKLEKYEIIEKLNAERSKVELAQLTKANEIRELIKKNEEKEKQENYKILITLLDAFYEEEEKIQKDIVGDYRFINYLIQEINNLLKLKELKEVSTKEALSKVKDIIKKYIDAKLKENDIDKLLNEYSFNIPENEKLGNSIITLLSLLEIKEHYFSKYNRTPNGLYLTSFKVISKLFNYDNVNGELLEQFLNNLFELYQTEEYDDIIILLLIFLILELARFKKIKLFNVDIPTLPKDDDFEVFKKIFELILKFEGIDDKFKNKFKNPYLL